MTQGDKHPEKFAKGQRLTAASLNGLTEAIQSVMSRMIGQQVVRPLNRQAILDADLLAAVDMFADPSTATAHLIGRKANGDLEVLDETVTVVNRFENISIDADTYIKIEWIDGEWQPYAADCGPNSQGASSLLASVQPEASAGVGGP